MKLLWPSLVFMDRLSINLKVAVYLTLKMINLPNLINPKICGSKGNN